MRKNHTLENQITNVNIVMLYFGSTKEMKMQQNVITRKWYTQTVAKMEKSKSQNSGILQHILKIYLIQKGIKYVGIFFRKSGNIVACLHLHQWVATLTKKLIREKDLM